MVNQKNSMGVAGFVLALIGLVLFWVPVFNWILWLLGLIFSIIGVTRKPKGLAIAGIAISFVVLIILITKVSLLASLLGLAFL